MVRQEAWRRDLPAYDMTQDPHFQLVQVELNAVLHLLNERDRSFAVSLQAQHGNRPLSSTRRDPTRMCQIEWVQELVRRGRANAQPSKPSQAAAQAPAGLTFSNLAKLFAQAGKRAVVVLRTAGGTDFRLSVAGERSQHPNSINVTDTSRSFEDRVWYGRITKAGGWVSSRKVAPEQLREIEAALAEFDADPAAAAAEYGRSVGACCFCRRELTDERSIHVGYGETCASRWGLPWGDVPNGRPKLTAQAVSESDIPF